MDIINLMIRDVVVIPNDQATPVRFLSSGSVQVRMDVRNLTTNGVIKDGFWTHTRDLPKPKPNTLYIVSSLVAMYELFTNDRKDLLFPWGLVKHDDGSVMGCRALCRPHSKG